MHSFNGLFLHFNNQWWINVKNLKSLSFNILLMDLQNISSTYVFSQRNLGKQVSRYDIKYNCAQENRDIMVYILYQGINEKRD